MKLTIALCMIDDNGVTKGREVGAAVIPGQSRPQHPTAFSSLMRGKHHAHHDCMFTRDWKAPVCAQSQCPVDGTGPGANCVAGQLDPVTRSRNWIRRALPAF